MLVHEDGAQLGEPVRWSVEQAKNDHSLVDREREQAHPVGERSLEPVGEIVGVGGSAEARKLLDCVVGGRERRRASSGEHTAEIPVVLALTIHATQRGRPDERCQGSLVVRSPGNGHNERQRGSEQIDEVDVVGLSLQERWVGLRR